MQPRDFGGRCGLRVPPISIGAMRLPADSMDAVNVIRHAIDCGMRYIDVSRGYGEAELVLGRALRDGYREKVFLSTKCSPWIKKIDERDDGCAESVLHRIEESLLRLDVEYLDFYQVWNINNREAWETATRDGGMVDGIRLAMDKGLVKHTGFTTHDSVENLLEYLPVADWCEIILVSYNLLKGTYAPILAKARELGIGTVVMNPVGGGTLADESEVFGPLCEEVGSVSLADLAVRYVFSNPNVDTMLCGMSKTADPDASIGSVERGAFSPEQVRRIEEFVAARSREKAGFCTGCKYCMPCPAGIKISAIMGAVYEDRFLGLPKSAERKYRQATAKVTPEACMQCGKCEEQCTQGLPVMCELQDAMARMGG